MLFKELKPKYQQLEIYVDKENYSLLEIPQIMKFDFAMHMFENKKVLYTVDHDDRNRTEVLIEK